MTLFCPCNPDKDYGMNFDFSFDFKPNSIPDGYGHVLQVGQSELSSYEDSMAFLFYNKNDYFQGGILYSDQKLVLKKLEILDKFL